MTRYRTLVSDEILPDLEAGGRMPAGLRLLRRVEGAEVPDGTHLVWFEDDDAPPEMEGHVVTPLFAARYDADPPVFKIMYRQHDCGFLCPVKFGAPL